MYELLDAAGATLCDPLLVILLAVMMMPSGGSSYAFSGKTDDVSFLLLKARAAARKIPCAHRRSAQGAQACSPTALAVRPIPWHMSIHDREYLWTAHGHSCLVIMAAVAPKSLLREVRSSPHCGSVRDQTSVMRSPTALAVRPIPWHMSIHDRDYLWTAHGHSCLVIMAAVAPKSLLREVRSSPHCGSVRDRRQRQRQQQH